MDLLGAASAYVTKMVAHRSICGMRVLILDDFTTQVVSMSFSLGEVLTSQVFLVELLASSVLRTELMTHLTAILFVRPTATNISLLVRELKTPKFREYHVFFSNIVSREMVQQIADADDLGVVRQIQEFYADFIPIDPCLFSLNSQRLISQSNSRPVSALLSVLLALKVRPSAIRFTASSPATRGFASEVSTRMAADVIFDLPASADSPVLLILDRKSDPVTPLLSQWTYQAMVHELLGLNNGRVLIPNVPEGEVVLSGRDDSFFEEHRYHNFGDLGGAIRDLMQGFAKEHRLRTDVKSIDDMRSFLERYPAFRSQSSRVSKHVTITAELSRLVEVSRLFSHLWPIFHVPCLLSRAASLRFQPSSRTWHAPTIIRNRC